MLTDVQSLQNQTALAQKPSKGSSELGKDEFLKLLTTQLANQDPTSPMENTEFIAQLAQFSSLEGITNLNKTVEGLVSVASADNAANAVSLIGKEVRYATKEVDGGGKLAYQMSEDADDIVIKFTGPDGLPNTLSGLKGKANEVNEIDLKDYPSLIPGTMYEIEISAKNAAGDPVQVVPSGSSVVTGVDYSGNAPVVHLENGRQANTQDVLEIRRASVAAPTMPPAPQPEPDQGEGTS